MKFNKAFIFVGLPFVASVANSNEIPLQGDIVFDRYTGCIDKVVKTINTGSEINITLSRPLGGYLNRIPTQLIKLDRSFAAKTLNKYELSCGSIAKDPTIVEVTINLNRNDEIFDRYTRTMQIVESFDLYAQDVGVRLVGKPGNYKHRVLAQILDKEHIGNEKPVPFKVGDFACDEYTGKTVKIRAFGALEEGSISFYLEGEPGGYSHRVLRQLTVKKTGERCPFDQEP